MSPLAEGSSPEEEPVAPASETPEVPKPRHASPAAVTPEREPEAEPDTESDTESDVESVEGAESTQAAPSADSTEQPAENDDSPAPGTEEEKRRYPSTIGGVFYLMILGVTIAGLVVVGAGHWRTGLYGVAGSLVAGAVLRCVLPQRDAGMLAVRARWIDVTVMGSMGVLLWVLATKTPNA